jgi:hypothetical protein
VKKKSSDNGESCDSYAEVHVPAGWNVSQSGGVIGPNITRAQHLSGNQDKSTYEDDGQQ